MYSNDIKQIELQIDTAKELVKDCDALDRLYKNKDFVRLIEKKYFQDEPVRLTHLLSDPRFQTLEARTKLHEQMLGVSLLLDFLRNINRTGDELREKVAEFEQERELALQEQE